MNELLIFKKELDNMPKQRRNWKNNACYHITHRCHRRKFLFKFAKQLKNF